MKFTKQHLCQLPCCYAVGSLQVQGEAHYIFATDGAGPCLAIDASTHTCQTIWDGPGGTMSIVPLPGEDGAFLACQQFLPGFSAAHAKIVMVRYVAGTWQVTPWMTLPYVHRFDILQRNGTYYFLGCILSSTTQEQAQWDEPGTLVAAPLSADFSPPTHLHTIARGMSRNHGYCRVERADFTQVYTACEQGVFEVTPPASPAEAWTVVRLLCIPASDIAVCDIDGDGVEELAVISPFHGDTFSLYRRDGEEYRQYYCYPKKAPFLHAIWGGILCGEPVFFGGYRAGEQELFLLRHTQQGITAQVIESGLGPSNVMVIHGKHHDTLLVANREGHEGALFIAEQEVVQCTRTP